MAGHKKTHCKKGHPLEDPNIIYNYKYGFRECRICKYARLNKARRGKKRKTTK